MCGIAGKINLDNSPVLAAELDAMRLSLKHRGPDAFGVKIAGGVGLAHARLSIIDLPGGLQPLSNEDESIWTVFNGEIYNFREIREGLREKGHIFKSNSDTEVIVHLYEEYGMDCVLKMNGMFAFALVDLKKRKFLLARDRLGQKPLYYFCENGVFAFASELSALKVLPEFPREIKMQSLHDYFSLQYIPAPSTAYEKVFKIPPAHTLELDMDGDFRLKRYWTLNFERKLNISENEVAEELRNLLLDAVRLRLISDVPLGVFLSGGLDSSIITALMAELGVSPIRTFTIGFTEKLYDERYLARELSAKFATCHFEKMGDPKDFDLLKSLIAKFGEPYADSSILPTALLSAFAAKEVKVALGGDGADELFCGYNRYTMMKYASFANILPAVARKNLHALTSTVLSSGSNERSLSGNLRRIFSVFAESPDKRYYRIIVRFDEEMKKNLYGEKMLNCEFRNTADYLKDTFDGLSGKSGVEKYSALDIETYLNGDILPKLDIASMASSLEARSPFLDYRVAEFAASLPLDLKLKGRDRKYILKKSFETLIPEKILNAKKRGFGVPLAEWFRGGWKKIAEENIIEGKAVKDAFISGESARRIINEHNRGKADHSYTIFALLCFSIWLEGEAHSFS